MRMEITLRPRLEQRLKLAPQIIQSIEILQLPLLALQERIDQEQLENPVLEIEEILVQPSDETPQDPADRKVDERIVEGQDYAKLDNLADDFRDYFYQTSSRKPPSEKDEKLEALQNTASPPMSLADHLTGQLRLLDLSDRTREIADFIINDLDADGRLLITLEDIVAVMEDPPSEEEAQQALKVVQSLDPPGVGARSLEECLLLQLDPGHPDHSLHSRIIRSHLRDLESSRLQAIARATGADIQAVTRAVQFVISLSPAPGRLFDNEVVPRVVPDVVVDIVDGRYEVFLEDRALPKLRLNPDYRQLAKAETTDTEAREFIQKKIESARWLIDAIQQRRRTLLRVSRAIVDVQRGFFEEGVPGLKPLKMQEVADQIEMHVATVSRAIRDKYMQTPRGIFAMKFFFTGGTRSANGEMESWEAVRERIGEIVANEDKSKPLSDDDIASRLGKAGLGVARRTVTKYRKLLSIPSSRQRKRTY